ncbi:Protein mak11, partial [Coemansia spiralis]
GTEYVLCGCQDKRIHIYSIAGADLASFHCHDNRIKGLCSVDMVFPDGATHTVVVSISSDGRIKVWDLAAMLASIHTGPEPAQPTDGSPELQIEPLAVYNAEARLTCVSVSNSTF